MSERQEHKKRQNIRLEYMSRFGKWLAAEPPMAHFIKWHRWKKSRPTMKEVEKRSR